MSATARLEFRVSPSDRARIEHAAELIGEPASTFARNAAEARADEILREYEATTRLPGEFFDSLYEALEALDAPAVPNAALRAAADRMRGMSPRA